MDEPLAYITRAYQTRSILVTKLSLRFESPRYILSNNQSFEGSIKQKCSFKISFLSNHLIIGSFVLITLMCYPIFTQTLIILKWINKTINNILIRKYFSVTSSIVILTQRRKSSCSIQNFNFIEEYFMYGVSIDEKNQLTSRKYFFEIIFSSSVQFVVFST